MFKKTIRALEELEKTKNISIPVSTDTDGYFDRECPSEACLFQFKIHKDDWDLKVRDEEVFCPFCGHVAPSKSWWPTAQIEEAKKRAVDQIKGLINQAMRTDADAWNRQQSRAQFIKITMNVKGGHQSVLVPISAAETMRLKIECSKCSCRYAVIGAAFFCPACGNNAAEHVFSQSIASIRRSLDAIPQIREAIMDKDVAATTVRLLIENGLQNAVTAFQRYAEALYTRHPGAPKARRNIFQNLHEGSVIWHATFGKNYLDHIGKPKLDNLIRMFQQRHLLAHQEGIVDADYISRSGDGRYTQGQRIVVRGDAVQECLDIIEKLASGLASDLDRS